MNDRADKPDEYIEGPDKPDRDVEDLDVAKEDAEDVKGGAEPVQNYSFKQAWPKKYSG